MLIASKGAATLTGSSALGTVAIGVMVGSKILGGFAERRAAKAARRAAQLNAFAARMATEFKVEDLEETRRRVESSQRVAAAHSGVALSSGSVVEVMNASAAEIEKEIYRTKFFGDLKARGAQIEIDSYGKMADNALLSAFLSAGATGIGGYAKLTGKV